MATSDDDVTAVNDDEEVFDDTDVVATPSVAMLVMRVVVGISVAMRVVVGISVAMRVVVVISVAMRVVVGISVAMRVVVVLFVAMLVIAKYILSYYHKQREIYTRRHNHGTQPCIPNT